MSDFGTEAWISLALQASCAVGVIALLAGILGLVRPATRHAAGAGAAATLFLVTAGLFLLTRPSGSSLGLADALLALPPALAAGGVAVGLRTVAGRLSGRGGAVVLLASGLTALALLGVRVEQRSEALGAPLSLAENDAEHIRHLLPHGAIQVAPPDPSYNCHDFAFFGGANGTVYGSVKELLASGGYAPVVRPQAGDVIIYYGPGADPLHSGVVKATGKDGFVLVESKWGQLGRYLHEATIPNFGVGYAFYRQGAEPAAGAVAGRRNPDGRGRATPIRKGSRINTAAGS